MDLLTVVALPKDVLILGPDFLLLNTPAEFECVDSEEGKRPII